MAFLARLLPELGGLTGVFSGLSNVFGPLTNGISSALRGIYRIIVNAFKQLAATFRTMVSAASRDLYAVFRRLPWGGISGALMYILLCNFGVIPCNRPMPTASMFMASQIFSPPPPPKPVVPLEYSRPVYMPMPSAPRLMSTPQPRPGFTITAACPWLAKAPATMPMAGLMYKSGEVSILTRTTSQQ